MAAGRLAHDTIDKYISPAAVLVHHQVSFRLGTLSTCEGQILDVEVERNVTTFPGSHLT